MRHLLIATGFAVGLAMQPALAEQDNAAAKSKDANQAETMHAPTNRVGEMVPTMSAPENKDDAGMDAAAGEKKPETMHAPTNRIGDQVPTMKSDENPDG
jgi:hypothetical protein